MNAERAQSYGRVMKTLADMGPAKLQPRERDLVREAADAMLFSNDLEQDPHAVMAFQAVAMEEGDFAGWLAGQADGIDEAAARAPGLAIFEAEGCGACHALRGTGAKGQVGPDLTHVGGRESLAAGILPMTVEALADWIRHPDEFNPGVEMPDYDHMDEADLTTLATWLEGLK